MGLKSWLSRGNSKSKNKTKNQYSDQGFFGRMFGRNKFAGIDVTYSTAMRHNDVYTCVRIKAESLGQLPVRLYRSDDDNKRTEITSGREWNIFTQKPNAYQTWQEFIETYSTSIELVGHFAAEIKRNRFGNVYELVPFRHQNNVQAQMDSVGRVYYTYSTNSGEGKSITQTYDANDILFIKSFSFDGFRGISTITQCALAIGTAIAGENHAASLFENGAMPMGVLQTDDSFGDDEEAVQRIRSQWNEMHEGSKNSGKTAILEYGLKYQPITMSAVDAQLLEQRRFSREQIASMFRVPLHLLQAATGMKYSNVEQNNIAFFRDSLMPLATKLENNINQILPANHMIKLDERGFVRGDRKALVSTIKEEISSGLCSLNEGRIELGRDPIDGGDVFAIKTNNFTFGSYDDIPKILELELAAVALPSSVPAGNENSPNSNSEEASSDDN
jgi:HK97 family phage portal protein